MTSKAPRLAKSQNARASIHTRQAPRLESNARYRQKHMSHTNPGAQHATQHSSPLRAPLPRRANTHAKNQAPGQTKRSQTLVVNASARRDAPQHTLHLPTRSSTIGERPFDKGGGKRFAAATASFCHVVRAWGFSSPLPFVGVNVKHGRKRKTQRSAVRRDVGIRRSLGNGDERLARNHIQP